MPIHLRENQYQGVNAHLHSFLQNEPGGWWETFHSSHISDIRRLITRVLPSGYYAINEKSLQISAYDLTTDEEQRTRIRPDVSIYRSRSAGQSSSPSFSTAPTTTVRLVETISDEDYLTSVVIYEGESLSSLKPVTRIELLSPGNKPPSTLFHEYLAKRDETLFSGVNMVEIDYLHQSRSPIHILPSYPKREPGAHPYSILVGSPNPSFEEGIAEIYGFRVNEPIPEVVIPLAGDDRLEFDLGAAYDLTYLENPVYGDVVVDYEQKPLKFETYDEEDQRRIEARMATIAEAQRRSSN